MANKGPLTDDELEQIRQANTAGDSCNAIAKRLGRSTQTVWDASKRMDLSWDRGGTEAANAALRADTAKRRLALRDRALTASETGYDVLEARTYKRIFKGERGVEEVREIDFIPPADRRDLAASIAQHVAIEARLAAVDNDGGVEAAKSMISKLVLDIGGELGGDLRTKIELNAADRTDV